MNNENINTIITGLVIILSLLIIVGAIVYPVTYRSEYKSCITKCVNNLGDDFYEISCMNDCLLILNITSTNCTDKTIIRDKYSTEIVS